jgi:hypothetical protein
MVAEVQFVAAFAPALLMAPILGRAAAFKLRDPGAFADAVVAYRIAPAALVWSISRILPVVEIVLAAALMFPPARRWTEGAAAVLMVVFAGAMALNLFRGRREIDCGCGDPARRQPLGWGLVTRNLVLAAILSASAFLPMGRVSVGGILVALACAFSGLLLLLCQEAFAALPRSRSGPRIAIAHAPGARG